MKSYYVRHGSKVRVTGQDNINIDTKLAAGTYTVMVDAEGFYLERIDDLATEPKLYGDVLAKSDRIINTFDDRPSTTGVLLEGEKGSGKTLLAKVLSKSLLDVGIPTLVINQPLRGEAFNAFMQSINQPTMVFFDEFEKTYKSEEQQQLLTLLDGSYSSKKLFVMTVNDTYRVIEHMKNRPGRFFYKINYKGLDEKFIRDYCADKLDNKEHIEQIVMFAASFQSFNFDILKALVEEMNRYKENVAEAMLLLNAVPFDQRAAFKVLKFELKKNDAKEWKLSDDSVSGGGFVNPYTDVLYFNFEDPKIKRKIVKPKKEISPIRDDNEWYNDDSDDDPFYRIPNNNHPVFVSPKDIIKIEGSTYYFDNEEIIVSIEKITPKERNYASFFAM